ncbi:MAG: phage protease, partial [Mycobacterium sp.]
PDFASGKDQGPTITEVGLTNKPFLRGMDPITCSFEPTHRRALSMDPEKTLAAIAKALGVPEDAGPEAMAAALQAIFALKAAQKGNTVAEEEGGGEPPAGEGEEPPPADENELELSLEGEPPPPADGGGETDAPAMAAEALGAVAEVMGVDLATVIASIREAPEAVAAALAPPAEGSEGAAFSMATFGAETRRLTAEVESLTGEKQALTTQVTELEKQLKEQSEQGTRRAELDSAIELGILRESQKAIALRFIDDEKAFRDYMDDAKAHPSVPQGTKLSTPGPDETGKGADTASARQEQVDALSPVEAAQYYQFYGTQGYDHGTAVKMSQEYSKRMEGKDMKQAGDVLHALKKDFGPPQQATK